MSQARVLVVDDYLPLRMAYASVLSSGGYLVTTAADGEEALRIVERAGCFDVVVLDYSLGGGRSGGATGLELEGVCRGKPIVFVTGYESLDLPDRGRHVVLTKPVSEEALLDAVEALLREPPV